MRINLTKETRLLLKDIARTTENEHVVFVFKGNLLYVIGYTSYYNEVLKVEVESDIYGVYRLHVDNIKTMASYEAVDINERENTLQIVCFLKKKQVCALKIKKEEEINQTATDIVATIEGLHTPKIFNISVFKEYIKLLKIIEGGLSLSNGFLYGEGDGFKLYSIATDSYDLAISSDVIRKLTKLMGESTVAFDLGNKLVCEKKGQFYLTFSKFKVKKKLDTSIIDIFPRLFSWTLGVTLKEALANISSKEVTLTLLGDKNSALIKGKNIEILSKLDVVEGNSQPNAKIILDKDILLTILKGTDFKEMQLVAYERFVLLKVGNIFYIIQTLREV